MPRRLSFALLSGLLAAGPAFALLPPANNWASAREAAEAVDQFADACVVEFSLPPAAGGAAAPHFGTLFRFQDAVWFYIPTAGVRSLAEGDRGDFFANDALARMVRLNSPDVGSVAVHRVGIAPGRPDQVWHLPNGCVVACLVRLGNLAVNDPRVRSAALVFIDYQKADADPPPPETSGHCVLVYSRGDGTFCFEPNERETFPCDAPQPGVPLSPAITSRLERRGLHPVRVQVLPVAADTIDEMRWHALQRRPPQSTIVK